MPLPLVAIVGRPNVGKSSVFNWLAERRISIVDPTAGVTRDRIQTTISAGDRYFDLVDTGGIGIVDVDKLESDVERQIQIAIEEAAVVIFLVDIRNGVMPLDQTVSERLRTASKPVIFVANKADEPRHDLATPELFQLGYGEPLTISAHQNRGREELLDAILAKLPPDTGEPPPGEVELKIAIVGRRNVGKSTFINSLAESERVIVSEIPGTTRDSIDVRFERDGKSFLAIDTAGVKQKKAIADNIEYYSSHRAERSIRRADVVLHLFDPRMKVSRVDKQLAGYVLDNYKPAVFVINKWDLAKDKIPTEKWSKYLRKMFPMLEHVPIAFITAKQGKNVYRLLNLAQQLHKQAGKRATTGELNRVLREAMAVSAPPTRLNRLPKIFYATQVSTYPPTIVMVTNGPELFDEPYVRYLTKVLRDNFPFGEVALKVVLRAKGDLSGRGHGGSGEETEVVPSLAAELPADVLDAVEIDEPPAPPKEPKAEKPKKKKKRKKPEPGTWEL